MRLIDADKLSKELEEFIENLPPFKGSKVYEEIIKSVFRAVIHFINRTHTVEMRPKGKWIDDGTGLICKCSVCGGANFGTAVDGYFKYCPDCGADMSGWNG